MKKIDPDRSFGSVGQHLPFLNPNNGIWHTRQAQSKEPDSWTHYIRSPTRIRSVSDLINRIASHRSLQIHPLTALIEESVSAFGISESPSNGLSRGSSPLLSVIRAFFLCLPSIKRRGRNSRPTTTRNGLAHTDSRTPLSLRGSG
jgi:hypothetical protein